MGFLLCQGLVSYRGSVLSKGEQSGKCCGVVRLTGWPVRGSFPARDLSLVSPMSVDLKTHLFTYLRCSSLLSTPLHEPSGTHSVPNISRTLHHSVMVAPESPVHRELLPAPQTLFRIIVNANKTKPQKIICNLTGARLGVAGWHALSAFLYSKQPQSSESLCDWCLWSPRAARVLCLPPCHTTPAYGV
jgi:hypothetical protein